MGVSANFSVSDGRGLSWYPLVHCRFDLRSEFRAPSGDVPALR